MPEGAGRADAAMTVDVRGLAEIIGLAGCCDERMLETDALKLVVRRRAGVGRRQGSAAERLRLRRPRPPFRPALIRGHVDTDAKLQLTLVILCR